LKVLDESFSGTNIVPVLLVAVAGSTIVNSVWDLT